MTEYFRYIRGSSFRSEKIESEKIDVRNHGNALVLECDKKTILNREDVNALITHLQAWLHTGSLAIAEPLQDATAFHDFSGQPFGGLIPANCPVCGSIVWKKDPESGSVPEGVKIEKEPTGTWKAEEKIVGLGAAKCPVCGLNRMIGHYTNDELQSRYCMYCGHQDTKP